LSSIFFKKMQKNANFLKKTAKNGAKAGNHKGRDK
jgi:hypothetical protein